METLLIYALCTSAAFYLGSRAVITHWLWSRYPRRLAVFMDCAACTGFWYGLGFAWLSTVCGYPVKTHYTPWVIGLCSMVWTPIVAGIMHKGFEWLGSAVDDG
jgi:hypothetical protein